MVKTGPPHEILKLRTGGDFGGVNRPRGRCLITIRRLLADYVVWCDTSRRHEIIIIIIYSEYIYN